MGKQIVTEDEVTPSPSIDWAKIPAHVNEVYQDNITLLIYYSKSGFENESEYTTHVRP